MGEQSGRQDWGDQGVSAQLQGNQGRCASAEMIAIDKHQLNAFEPYFVERIEHLRRVEVL